MDLDLATTFMATLVVLGLVAVIAARFVPALDDAIGSQAMTLAAIVAVAAMASSLYLSGVADLIPCRWCWWQRIFMYPLAVILAIAAWRRDETVRWYAIPLASIGLVISAWHSWVQAFPSDTGSCDIAAPCSVKLVEAYGVFTIPRMTGLTFLLVLLLLTRRRPAISQELT